ACQCWGGAGPGWSYGSLLKVIAGVLLDCDANRIARRHRRRFMHDVDREVVYTSSKLHRTQSATGEEDTMGFEDKEAELGLLFTCIQNEPEDWGEVYEQVRQKLNELKAYGMPLPADLVQFEHDLEAEFAAEKEDAERRGRI